MTSAGGFLGSQLRERCAALVGFGRGSGGDDLQAERVADAEPVEGEGDAVDLRLEQPVEPGAVREAEPAPGCPVERRLVVGRSVRPGQAGEPGGEVAERAGDRRAGRGHRRERAGCGEDRDCGGDGTEQSPRPAPSRGVLGGRNVHPADAGTLEDVVPGGQGVVGRRRVALEQLGGDGVGRHRSTSVSIRRRLPCAWLSVAPTVPTSSSSASAMAR